jgi:hypothetical protein
MGHLRFAEMDATIDYVISPLTTERWPALEDVFGRAGASNGCWCVYWRIGPRYHDRRRADNTRKSSPAGSYGTAFPGAASDLRRFRMRFLLRCSGQSTPAVDPAAIHLAPISDLRRQRVLPRRPRQGARSQLVQIATACASRGARLAVPS